MFLEFSFRDNFFIYTFSKNVFTMKVVEGT